MKRKLAALIMATGVIAVAVWSSPSAPVGAVTKTMVSTAGQGHIAPKTTHTVGGKQLTKWVNPPDGKPPRAIPASSAHAMEPHECDGVDFCDHWALRVPLPANMSSGDDFDLELSVEWCDTSVLDLALYDNKQTKLDHPEQVKKPGDDAYQPSDTASDYTRLGFSNVGGQPSGQKEFCTNPSNPTAPATTFRRRVDLVTLATPDLRNQCETFNGKAECWNYNVTVLLFSGTNSSGYWIEARTIVHPYEQPEEILEPEAAPTSQDFTPFEVLPEDIGDVAAPTALPDPDSVPALSSRKPKTRDLLSQFGGGTEVQGATATAPVSLEALDAPVDPLLQGIIGSDLESQLDAPALEVAGAVIEPIPPPPGAAALAGSLLVLPVVGGAAGATFMARRRSVFRLP